MSDQYAAITAHAGQYAVRLMCDALAVSVSGYHEAKTRADGLQARRRRAVVRTTDSAHADPIAPNHRSRCFALAEHPVPNRTWVGDLTYIPTRSGWLYFAVPIDLATRGVVDWTLSTSMATALPLRALQHAIQRQRPAPGLTHHTDRGSRPNTPAERTARRWRARACARA